MTGAADRERLALPAGIRACLFDLDGVVTNTAAVHATAWKATFDEFLRLRARRTGHSFVPFDPGADYLEYVDDRPREDGVRSFLAARGIALPEGQASLTDTSGRLAGAKADRFLAVIRERGVDAYRGSVRYVTAARAAGLKCAVVSASANAREVLEAAEVAHLFDERIDGLDAQQMNLAAKPAPAMYLAAARALWSFPAEAAVFEDAVAGVAAGRAGSFGFVVGVDRVGQARELREHGADVVVSDLADLLAEGARSATSPPRNGRHEPQTGWHR